MNKKMNRTFCILLILIFLVNLTADATQIFIYAFDDKTYETFCEYSDTVKTLKDTIRNKYPALKEVEFGLFSFGIPMEDTKTLSEYQIDEGIRLIFISPLKTKLIALKEYLVKLKDSLAQLKENLEKLKTNLSSH